MRATQRSYDYLLGYNASGQATPPSGTFTAVSAGESFACGIRSDQTLACWGQPMTQTPPLAGTYSALAAGNLHACALRSDGRLVCWGTDLYGETRIPVP